MTATAYQLLSDDYTFTEWNTVARNKMDTNHVDCDFGIVTKKVPGSESGSAISLNFLGKQTDFVVTGTYFGTTAQCTAFVSEMRKWGDRSWIAQGGVPVAEFHDGLLIWEVKPKKFIYDWTKSRPGEVPYQLLLVRGSI